MTRSPVSPLNRALYERLKHTMAVSVYDHVPAGKKAPYVVLTDTTAQSWTTKTISGAVVTATIKIISEYQGDKEVAELADAAIAAMDQPLLELSEAWQVVLVTVDNHSVERFESYREATVLFKFTIIDTRE